MDIEAAIPGPGVLNLLNPDANPVDVVLLWIDETLNVPAVTLLFPESTNSHRVEKEKIRKWKNGVDEPSSQSILLFSSALKSVAANKLITDTDFVSEKLLGDGISAWLLIAAALARLEKKSQIIVRPLIKKCLEENFFADDTSFKLAKKVQEVGESWPELRELGVQVWNELWRTTEKKIGAQKRTYAAIERLQTLAEQQDPNGKTVYHYFWMRARWSVLSGQYEEALALYKQAFDLATYRAGAQTKEIIQEAVCLAGLFEKKTFLKQLKNVGIAVGLFHKNKGEQAFEDWESEQFSEQLLYIFPITGRFPESIPSLLRDKADAHEICPLNEPDTLKPDLKRPDRVRAINYADGSVCRWPQLRFFVAQNNYEAVNSLITAGADVNQLDNKGATALLVAIKLALKTGDRRVLDRLLVPPYKSESLNTPTPRQRITPLYRAIELGEPDVVRCLLLKGANPDCHFLPDKQTALYYAVSLLWRLTYPKRLHKQLLQRMLECPDLMQKDVLRRHGVNSAGIYGENQKFLYENSELLNEVVKTILEDELGRHSKPNMMQIIRWLLIAGANPNAGHQYPVPGRTPLMLAAESNLVQVFALMVEKFEGNPLQRDADGQDSYDIARSFNALDIMAYMG